MQDAYRSRGVQTIATGYKRLRSTAFQELGSYSLTTYSETSPGTVSTSYPGRRYLATTRRGTNGYQPRRRFSVAFPSQLRWSFRKRPRDTTPRLTDRWAGTRGEKPAGVHLELQGVSLRSENGKSLYCKAFRLTCFGSCIARTFCNKLNRSSSYLQNRTDTVLYRAAAVDELVSDYSTPIVFKGADDTFPETLGNTDETFAGKRPRECSRSVEDTQLKGYAGMHSPVAPLRHTQTSMGFPANAAHRRTYYYL
jgi:hypothetical protein